MSDEKQTAVEWLIESLIEMEFDLRLIPHTILRAKQLEKCQHNETWQSAHQVGRFEGKGIAEENWQTFEQYYNEIYGKD